MRLGVPKETAPAERAASRSTASAGWPRGGIEVVVESGAGVEATFFDEAYRRRLDRHRGGRARRRRRLQGPRPSEDEVALLSEGAVLVGLLQPLTGPSSREPRRAA